MAFRAKTVIFASSRIRSGHTAAGNIPRRGCVYREKAPHEKIHPDPIRPLRRDTLRRALYIVNGVETEEIESIPPDDIENIESLPADEETIARYGEKAANGVILISLRYDKPAVFEAGTTFDEYIAGQVKWDDDEPAARIILRYTVTPEGKAVLAQELESTDNRLKRRVLKALSEAPHWHPAQKNGVAVASEGVLHIQLPKGKRMPRPVELVWR